MERNTVNINSYDMAIKEYNGQRVVTFKDIDAAHERPEGTARRNFNNNRQRFIEGEDYFKVSMYEIRTHNIMDLPKKASSDVYLFTQSGYLMLVKSFTDDLSWQIQRLLVNSYFALQDMAAQQFRPLDEEYSAMIRRTMECETYSEWCQALTEPLTAIRVNLDLSSNKAVLARIYSLFNEKYGFTVEDIRQEKIRRLIDKGNTMRAKQVNDMSVLKFVHTMPKLKAEFEQIMNDIIANYSISTEPEDYLPLIKPSNHVTPTLLSERF